MAEYITGRVKLSECSSSKAISNNNDKNKKLSFKQDDTGKIVVEEVPGVYGVRCGAVVKGFSKGHSTIVQTVEWPDSSKERCTLSEIIRSNKISQAEDTLVFETECTFCTQTVTVDTKEFGLPQVRQRVYMFVWRPHDNNNIHDDLGEYWVEIVKHLQSTCRNSLESFMLPDDHEAIRVFREALHGPPGRLTKSSYFRDKYFWTEEGGGSNLPHNKYTRKHLGLKDEARWHMNWGPNGKRQVPPHYWLEYINCNHQRVIDFLDILNVSAFRDAEAHDPSFSAHFWNLSQNASKEKHRTAVPGVASCITPGGDFFVPHHGRPLLGCEKLLLQGLPYSRLILGVETEVQLSDLAGNAMSLTVVCATMLASLTCQQLRQEVLSTGKSPADILKQSALSSKSNKAFPVALDRLDDNNHCESALPLFQKLCSLAEEAFKSSLWCTCESSGRKSESSGNYLQCTECRVSCCQSCVDHVAKYNLSSHKTRKVHIENDAVSFQAQLRQIVPPALCLSEELWQCIKALDNDDSHQVGGITGCSFNLHRIKRERRKWVVVFYAKQNHGIGEAVAGIELTIGELFLKGMEPALGVMVELTSYTPARMEKPVFGLLEPCAKMLLLRNENGVAKEQWLGRKKNIEMEVQITCSGQKDSPRIEMGLLGEVETLICSDVSDKQATAFKRAKERGEERRWIYPENWKRWPECITLQVKGSAGDASRINGQYVRASCRQTMNQSALWRKRGVVDQETLFLVIRPNVNRTGPDRAVITSSLDHSAHSCIVAEFPTFWQPCDASETKTETLTIRQWEVLHCGMGCQVPPSALSVSCSPEQPDLFFVKNLTDSQITTFCCGRTPEGPAKLNAVSGQDAQQVVRTFNSICAAPILKLAASSEMKYDLSPNGKWSVINTGPVAFGCCTRTIPPRPTEEWVYNDSLETFERRSNPEESRKYYLQLQEAPKAFELWIDKSSRSLSVKFFPEVVAHHAAGNLIHGRGEGVISNDVLVSFKLSDITQQKDPVINPFVVRSCSREHRTKVPLKEPHKLFERQEKVITQMIGIELGEKQYEELEASEQTMPGSTGMTLMAKATRRTNIRGGVIADAIGAGKTVVSIGIILKGLMQARASRRQTPRSSGATLVLVPPALIQRWETEFQKFVPDNCNNINVVKIYGFKSYMKGDKEQDAVKLEDVINADVVICPINILQSKGYMENLIRCAKLLIKR